MHFSNPLRGNSGSVAKTSVARPRMEEELGNLPPGRRAIRNYSSDSNGPDDSVIREVEAGADKAHIWTGPPGMEFNAEAPKRISARWQIRF